MSSLLRGYDELTTAPILRPIPTPKYIEIIPRNNNTKVKPGLNPDYSSISLLFWCFRQLLMGTFSWNREKWANLLISQPSLTLAITAELRGEEQGGEVKIRNPPPPELSPLMKVRHSQHICPTGWGHRTDRWIMQQYEMSSWLSCFILATAPFLSLSLSLCHDKASICD